MMFDDPTIFDAALRTARAVAAVTGTLVTIDAIGVLAGPQERPPHQPRMNAAAWAVAGATTAFVAGWMLIFGYGVIGPDDPVTRRWLLAVMWSGLAAAFTIRAAYRAFRPWRIAALSLGMAATMFVFALIDVVLP